MDGEKKKPVLKSAEELKGKKALAKRRRLKWPLLLALVVVAVGCWAIVTQTTLFTKPEEAPAPIAESTRVTLLEKSAPDLDRVTIALKGGDSYTIVNQIRYDEDGNRIELAEGESEYLVEGRPDFKLNTQTASRIAQGAVRLTAQSTVSENAEDLSVYGLDSPQLVVDVAYRDGTKANIEFGDQLPTGSNRYMRFDGGNAVYTASSTAFGDFNKPLNSLHAVELPFEMNAEVFKRLVIEQQGLDTIELEMLDAQVGTSISLLRMRQPYDIDAHASRAPELLDAVAAIALEGYAGHADAPEGLAEYGLLEPRARITYSQSDGNEITFAVGNATGDGLTCVTIDESGDVYTVKTSVLSLLSGATPAKLVDQFAGLVDIKTVDKLIVEGNGKRYELGIARTPVQNDDGTEATEDSYLFDGASVAEKPFKALYQEIIGLTFDKFRDGESPLPGAPLVTVRFVLNNGMADQLVEYLEYDGDYCLIRTNDSELFLIKRTKVLAMLDKCEQFAIENNAQSANADAETP